MGDIKTGKGVGLLKGRKRVDNYFEYFVVCMSCNE